MVPIIKTYCRVGTGGLTVVLAITIVLHYDVLRGVYIFEYKRINYFINIVYYY